MFGKDKARPAPETPPASAAAAPQETAKESVVAPTMTVKGDIDFEGSIRIEGEVHGMIRGQGRLTVDPTGKVLGDVAAAEVVIHGTVQGNVDAPGRLEIAGTAQVAGDVKASQLVVARGAKILGRLDIDSESMSLSSNGRKPAPPAEVDALDKVL